MRLLCGMLLLAQCAIAVAQTSTAADRQAVTACLDTAKADGKFGGHCIGTIADPCIKDAQQAEPNLARACAKRELAVWNELLSSTLVTVNKAGSKFKRSIADAEKTWRASQDKLCPIFDSLDPGMVLGASDYCRLHETGRRVLVLQWLAAAVVEH